MIYSMIQDDIFTCTQKLITTTTTTTLHPFNGIFFRTTWVSQYLRDKTSLDLNEAGSYHISTVLLLTVTGFFHKTHIVWLLLS